MKFLKFMILQDWFESFIFILNFLSWSNWTAVQLNNLILIRFYTWSWSIAWKRIFVWFDLNQILLINSSQFQLSKIMFYFVWFDSNQIFNMIRIKLFCLKVMSIMGYLIRNTFCSWFESEIVWFESCFLLYESIDIFFKN